MKDYNVKKKEKEILLENYDNIVFYFGKGFFNNGLGKESFESTHLTSIKKSCFKMYEALCKIEGYNDNPLTKSKTTKQKK